MNPVALSLKSVRNRRVTVGLTVLSIALSVALLLGVERLRREARTGFTNTISGTDLIVGARTSPLQLMLSSVFRLSDASNNIDWHSYVTIISHPAVTWSIPISLGDSHRGYRVVGTTAAYLEHLRYGRKQRLRVAKGAWFEHVDGCVLGSEVASTLGYGVGDHIVVAHGAGEVSFLAHDEHPFQVTGILAPTGTPVDRSVHVSLEGVDAIHHDMQAAPSETGFDPLAAAMASLESPEDRGHHEHRGESKQITAFLIGLTSRAASLGVQRMVNEYEREPLTAVVPGVALQQLWEVVGVIERALLTVSVFVVVVGLAGMLVAIMTGLNERRREMAILRSVGARPAHVFGLIVGEAALVTGVGVVTGYLLLYALLLIARPVVMTRLGLHLAIGGPTPHEMMLAGIVLCAGILSGVLPAFRSCRLSLADGLTVRM